MERPAQNAGKLVRQLADLAERLAAKDFVVASLRAMWSFFGCWELQVQRGDDTLRYTEAVKTQTFLVPYPKVVRFFWDGRDHELSINESTGRSGSTPTQFDFSVRHVQRFEKPGEEVLRFVEDYLDEKLAK